MEKLGKIIQLAKHGIGGEKANAIRIVKALCKKHNLDFKQVMEEQDEQKFFEYTIPYKTEDDLEILCQIFCRYGQTSAEETSHYNKYRKVMIFKTTQERYIEMLNAVSVLIPMWHKEKKVMKEAIKFAFLDRHFLYYTPSKEEEKTYWKKNKKEDKDEEKAREAGSSLARHMDEAIIRKQLK